MSNMVVRTNVFALNAHRNLTNTGQIQRRAAGRLSSGYRINSAADDAAGLAISESMRAQIRGLDQASVNAQDGIGLIQTAEGAMSTVSDMIIRIRELMVQAANDTNTLGNRETIQLEIDQIMQEINDVTFRTQFNTRTLLDGGLSGGGGDTHPVSLQWMLFNQSRAIGMATPSGQLEPNNRNHNSIRNEIITLQDELNELIDIIAQRQVDQGVMSRNDFNFNFRHLTSFDPLIADTTGTSEGNLNILQSNGLTSREVQQIRSITNRLNNTVLDGVKAAQEIYRITNSQVSALGGQNASNVNSSNVFIGVTMDDWFSNLHLWWEQLYESGGGVGSYFSWYQGGINPDGTPNELRNSAFAEASPGDRTGASETLFHIENFTGNGTGGFIDEEGGRVSVFDEIINRVLGIQAGVTSDEPTETTELAFLSRSFRLLVGFEMIDGTRVPAHTDLRIPTARRTSENAFVAAWRAEAAAQRSLMAVNHANAVNDTVNDLYNPHLSVLTALRNMGTITLPLPPSVSPSDPNIVAVQNALNALAALAAAIPPVGPADDPANLWPRMWEQAGQAITNAINRGDIFNAAEQLFFNYASRLDALAGHSFTPSFPLTDTVILNAIEAVGGTINIEEPGGVSGPGLNSHPFNTSVGAGPTVSSVPSYGGNVPTSPGYRPPPTTADPPGTPSAPAIPGLPTVPAIPGLPVAFDPARTAATHLYLGNALYHNNRTALGMPGIGAADMTLDSLALVSAVSDAWEAAVNLRAVPPGGMLGAQINAVIGAPPANNGGLYGLYHATRTAYAGAISNDANARGVLDGFGDPPPEPGDADYDDFRAAYDAVYGPGGTAELLVAARNSFQGAVTNLQTGMANLQTAANSAVVSLYSTFQTVAGTTLNNNLTNTLSNIMNNVRQATDTVLTAITNARTNANATAYSAAQEAFRLAERTLNDAIIAANEAVEANAWESLAAIIVPTIPGPPWIDLPPGESPFPGIQNPPIPQLTLSDVDYNSPVGAAFIAARNALAAFAPASAGVSGLPSIVFPPSSPPSVRDPAPDTTTLPASAPPQSPSGPPLSTGTLTPIPLWTAPVGNSYATDALYTVGNLIRRGDDYGVLSDSMLEARQADAIPFYMPRYGFVSRLENLLDKGLNALATVNLESNAMWFQIGANEMQGMILQLKGMHTGILGGGRGDLALMIDVREESGIPISEQLEFIATAEGIVNAQRAQLGAVQNRLEYTRQSLDNSSENLSSAESRIRNTDMALEMMRFVKAQILQQAGTSMLSQSNQLPQAVLQLLQ